MKFDNKKFEEEIDFKNVKDNPVRWFGAVYPYFIILIIFIGTYYVSKLNTININKIPPVIIDSTALWYDLPAVQGSVIKGIDVNIIKTPTKNLIEKGKTAFVLTCSPCHGNEGKGDGPAGSALNPKPRNFTVAQGWIIGRKFSDIYKTLQEGIKGTAMTAYEFLPIEERVALTHYIRSLADDYPAVTDDEIALLNSAYSLTGDRITPNQIPVYRAIYLIDLEHKNTADKVDSIVQTIKLDESPAAQLFKDNASSPDKAIAQLLNNNTWKESPEVFVSIISNDGPKSGFCPRIAKFSKEDVSILYNYLKSKL